MRERLKEELRNYLVVAAYLYVCFGALLLYKAALLSGSGSHTVSLGLAAGKALIIGKFVLIGEAVGVGTRGATRNLVQRVGRHVVLLLGLLVVLTIVEELIVGRVHGRSMAETIAEFRARWWPELAANCLMMMLVLVPLVTVTELNRALGKGELRRLLLDSTPRP